MYCFSANHVVPKGGRNIYTKLVPSKMVSMLAAAGRQTLSRKLQNIILIYRRDKTKARAIEQYCHRTALVLADTKTTS
jgi:hypothetical protein